MTHTSMMSAAAAAIALLAAGCGGTATPSKAPATSTSAPSASNAVTPPAAAVAAEHVSAPGFPSPSGRSLQQVASTLRSAPQLGLAVSVLLPGRQRFAFGLISSNEPLYAKSAVYIARAPNAPARGPFPASLDPMIPPPPYLSTTVGTDPGAVKSIYEATVPFPRPGRYAVLTVSRVGGALLGATASVDVAASSAIPNVGQRPPRIHTPTAGSVHGDLAMIDTRVPPDDMERVDFASVIGTRPVALLFATPALCQSRTCGPVTDQEVELEHEFGGRMTFIHNEVYVDNDPSKGYRPQLRAFHLRTEPWLFTFDRQGRVAARLEGAFGINAFRRAVVAALK